MKHAPTPWVLKNAYPGSNLSYYQIFDADGDGVLGKDSATMDEFSIMEETAKHIVECVNAMESIENPQVHLSHMAYERDKAKQDRSVAEQKYHKLKEVIQNLIDRLDEGAELTPTKDSIIVHCLREAIK